MSVLDWRARVRDLWGLLDDLDELGFSLDPRQVADNLSVLWDLVNRVRYVATEPPPGDPSQVEGAADDWKALADVLGSASSDLAGQVAAVGGTWTGGAAAACTRTLRLLARRADDGSVLALSAHDALHRYADELRSARARHGQTGDHLRSAGGRMRPCWPWEADDMVRGVLADVADAARAAIGAYQAAGEAAEVCDRVLARVRDEMPFPGGAPGLSAFDMIGLHEPGTQRRPLAGDVATRADAAYLALTPQDRATVDALLAQAPTTQHRAWVLAALAAGASVVTLTAFAARIGGERADRLRRLLDPTAQPTGTLEQQSPTTCGSASLLVARMLTDPVYALWVLDGFDARTGETDHRELNERFAELEREVKARTNDVVDRSGGLTLPWPSGLGTPPWGAGEELNNGAGVPGTGYEVGLVDTDSPADRRRAYDALAASAASGRPAPLYVGDDASPRHVVLVVGRTGDGLQVYDPARGAVVAVREDDFVSGDLSLSGWQRPWAVVTP